MFERLLHSHAFIGRQAPTLGHYLSRHIEMDSEDHGPAAHQLLQRLIEADPSRQRQADNTALGAVESRITLWHDVLASMQEVRP